MNLPIKAGRIDLRDVSTFPTRRDESWRWSDFRRVVPGPAAPAPEIARPAPGGPFATLDGGETLFANGRLADGAAHARVVLDAPTHRLRFVTQADGAGWQASAEVVVPADVAAVLMETYEGTGAYVASTALTFRLEPGASLERLVLLDEPADAISVSSAEVELGAGARFAQTVVATGARLQRHETRLTHPGQGVEVRLDGAYLLGGTRHADLTTVVAHTGGGVTSQVCKGVAADRAKAVFQGCIEVRPGADGTNARLRHDALLLSDRAEVDAKPELEIYADDVQCAHGATVGALDEEALFYARARGIPEPEAKVMLTQAFIGEVVERIAFQPAREVVQAWTVARLEDLA